MPHMEELREDFAKNDNVVFITVSINREVEQAWDFLTTNGYTHFLSLREADLNDRPTMADYNVSRIPQAFVVDVQGVIRYAGHPDYIQDDTIQAILSLPPTQ